MKTKRTKLLAVALAVFCIFGTVIPSCGFEGDPVLDDIYSRNVIPGADNTYSIGSFTYRYAEGRFVDLYSDTAYFGELYVNGARVTAGGGGGGVTDHGALTGLLDDDHPQYHNDARGDIRYYPRALLDGGSLDARYYTEVELDAGQLDTRYYTEGETSTLITNHSNLSTGTHGVGTGTISSVSTADKNIYVDKEAAGSANGTSWTDAFTTIQAAIDSMEDIIIHAYTIYVRDGTKKTGTADANVLNKLHDTGEFPVATTWAGRRVFNVNTGAWGVVSARDSDDQLSIVDIAGAALDLFPAGNEAYVIEATPYRETYHLNDDPASYPSHLILGSLNIEAEYYWYGDCDAQVNAGEILDAAADFTGCEVGDRVFVWDLNGANGRVQDYEVGTVDDVSQIGADIVRTTLAKTPTTNWRYVIVKTNHSCSDDGTEAGTARNAAFGMQSIDNVDIYGFYYDFSGDILAFPVNARAIIMAYFMAEECDKGIRASDYARVGVSYAYIDTNDANGNAIRTYGNADITSSDLIVNCPGGRAVAAERFSHIYLSRFYIDNATRGVMSDELSNVQAIYGTISANAATGAWAYRNSTINLYRTTNNGIIPESPVGTVEGSYIF